MAGRARRRRRSPRDGRRTPTRARAPGRASKMSSKLRVPVVGEEQRVVRQLGQLALDAEHARARHRGRGRASAHQRLRVGLQLAREQRRSRCGAGRPPRPRRRRRSAWLAVPSASALARRVDPGGAPRGPRCGSQVDRRRRCAGARRPARPAGHRLDDAHEAAARVVDAVGQVEAAHQVVHARRAVGRGAEEDGRVAEDLAQPRVAGSGRRRTTPASGPAGPTAAAPCRTIVGAQQGGARLEAGVEEVLQRRGRRLRSARLEVALQRRAGAGLERLEERDGWPPGSARMSSGSAVALEEHAVAGVEQDQVELAPRRWCRAGAKKWSKTSGIRYHDGPVSKRNPSRSHEPARPPELVALLEQVDVPPVAGEQGGGGQAGDAAADDDRGAGGRARSQDRCHDELRRRGRPGRPCRAGHPDAGACGTCVAGVRAQAAGELGEQGVRRTRTARRLLGGQRPRRPRRRDQVGVDVVEQAVLLLARRACAGSTPGK